MWPGILAAALYTFTIARQPTAPQFASETPQKLAVVELMEGVRLTTTLVNVDEAQIRIGMNLEPYFDRVSPDITLLRYDLPGHGATPVPGSPYGIADLSAQLGHTLPGQIRSPQHLCPTSHPTDGVEVLVPVVERALQAVLLY